MTAASKSQLEMNAAAALAGLSIPSNDTLRYGDYCLERQMFGEMEITFPMKVRRVSLPSTKLNNFHRSL